MSSDINSWFNWSEEINSFEEYVFNFVVKLLICKQKLNSVDIIFFHQLHYIFYINYYIKSR